MSFSKLKKRKIALALALLMLAPNVIGNKVFAVNGTLLTNNVTQTLTGHYSTNVDTNFPATVKYNDSNYSGDLPRTSVNWTQTFQYNYKTGTSSIAKYGLSTNSNSQFPSSVAYNDGAYVGTLPLSNVAWTPVYKTDTMPYSQTNTYYVSTQDNNQFPATINVTQGAYSGPLTRGTVTYTSNQTTQVPVYRTDTQYFSGSRSVSNVGNTSNGNFPGSIPISSNGYSGNIPFTSSSWSSIVATGRWSPWLTAGGDYGWYTDSSPVPSSAYVSYYDGASGQTASGYISRSNVYAYTSRANSWREYCNGGFEWMSNSSTRYDYYSGAYHRYWSDASPKWPVSYYGWGSGGGWVLYDAVWNGAMWKETTYSDTGKLNSYQRSVYLYYYRDNPYTEYYYHADFGGTIALPDVVTGYNGTAYYGGNLSKQVVDHYDTVTTQWKATVNYSGTLSNTYINAYNGTASYSGQVVQTVPTGYDGVANYGGPVYQRLNASPAPTNTGYSLSAVPGTESITVSGIQTYDNNNTIDGVKVSIYKGTTKVAGDYSATLSSTSGYYKAWNNVVFNLPTSLSDGAYVIKVTSYVGATQICQTSYNMTISTPINLKAYVNGIDADSGTKPKIFQGDTFTVNETTSTYTNRATVKFPFSVTDGISTYPANTEINLNYDSTSGGTNFYSKSFITYDNSIVDMNYYNFSFTAYAKNYVSTEKQTKTMSIQMLILRILSLNVGNIVNPQDSTVFPKSLPTSTPIQIKTGYNVSFNVGVQGASEVWLSFYCNGSPIGISSANKSASNEVYKVTGTATSTTVPVSVYFSDLPVNSVIDVKITAKSGGGYTIVDDIMGKASFKVVGSFREDFNVNLIR